MRRETPFSRILRRAVDRTPGALGGTFAAGDGETVDYVADGWRRSDWELLTAHHGVLLGHVRSALRTFHYGDPTFMVVTHRDMHVLMSDVSGGYFALMAVAPRAALAAAERNLGRAAARLRAEMAG
ncbi:MAG TPA: hypothetical protein VKZ63_17440 [Kofleriaceae bacterium]|nr:hypothetical protein [Kofleriaceae bacterium]